MRTYRRAPERALRRRLVVVLGPLAASVVVALPALAATPVAAADRAASAVSATAAPQRLYLVTLDGPGSAGVPAVDRAAWQLRAERRQRAVLAEVGAPEPVYAWGTALSGVAVELSRDQASALAADRRVALVEPDEVRPLAGLGHSVPAPTSTPAPPHGGRGIVVGVVDSGLAPESTSFATRPSLGRAAGVPRGACAAAEDWSPGQCGGKVVAARWFVDGFGRDAVRAGSALSPRDDDGHGTQMASIAAGNADQTVRVRSQQLLRTGGRAPDARIAAYKACWSAPDPRDDGCAASDLVAAVDQAVADGVDVLSLSVAGPDRIDTVERALLGAAEADVVVVAAAGNDARSAYAAHPSPWVTTVGATAGEQPRGAVIVRGGPTLRGVTASRTGTPTRPLVLGADTAAAQVDPADASVCAPGSLDAALVADRVVVCERGVVGRVDKSATVALADGAGMVLVNRSGRSTFADFHEVPTVHLGAGPGDTLVRWLHRHPEARAALSPGGRGRPAGLAAWSPSGDPVGGLLKPDVVAPGAGLYGAVPGEAGTAWDVASGTSAATAWAAGVAASLRARHPGWSAIEVRSALATSAGPMPGAPVLRAGAGRLGAGGGDVRLTYAQDVRDYRSWLDGRPVTLNAPSVLLPRAGASTRRTITNTADRSLYFSSSVRGVRSQVTVLPAAVLLDPGERATFVVRDDSPRSGVRTDDGHVVWRGGDGSRSRIPLVVHR